MIQEIPLCLKEIYEKITTLGNEIELTNIKLFKRDSKNNRNNKKIEQLIQINKLHKKNIHNPEIVYFNIGGKIFPTNKNMILRCEYDNILTNICKDLIKKGQNLNETKKIIIDKNPKNFKIILDLIRKLDDKREGISIYYNNIKKIIITLKENKVNIPIFKRDLEYYFNDSFEKLFDVFEFNYMSNNSIKRILGNNTNLTLYIENTEISAEFPNDLLTPYKTSSIEDIMCIDNIFKAIFLDYDASVIFSFNEPVIVKQIELRPFWLDLDCWFPGDGAGSKVMYSIDKNNWNLLCRLPEDYGFEMGEVHKLIFEEKEMKYLKFETKEYALSICYIKIS